MSTPFDLITLIADAFSSALQDLSEAPIKGAPVYFTYAGGGPYTTTGVDITGQNAVNVVVSPPTGTGIRADVHVQGSDANGGFVDLFDPNAVQLGVTGLVSIDCLAGTRYVAVRLDNISGTPNPGQAWQIVLTPYVSPGQGRVQSTIVVNTLSAIQTLTGSLTISDVCSIGTSGGIYQGTGSFASPTTGLKISNSGGIGTLQTFNGGTLQVQLDTTGKLSAGAGVVALDATGLKVVEATGVQSNLHAYQIVDSTGGIRTTLSGWNDGAGTEWAALILSPPTGQDGVFEINVQTDTGSPQFRVNLSKGVFTNQLNMATNSLTYGVPGSPLFSIDSVGNLTLAGGAVPILQDTTPRRIEAGVATVNASSSLGVTFPVAFSATPVVTCAESVAGQVAITNVSGTGFTIVNTASTANTVQWIAIGAK